MLIMAACGGSSSQVQEITAVIAAEPAQGIAPLTVQLSVAVSGDNASAVHSYTWSFGDGQSSTEENPVHVFEQGGLHTVTVTVNSTSGAVGHAETTVSVGDNDHPVASASASPSSGIAPLLVSFTGVGIGGNDPLTYRWNFGDGSAEVEQQNPTHTFDTAGTYSAILIVTDANGDEAQATVTVEVASNDVPVVEIVADRTSGIAPLTVGLQVVVQGGNAPFNYAWDFGDGETSLIATPSHVFDTGGTYTVSVTVTDANGDEDSDTVTITVGDDDAPSATATATPDSGLQPLTVNLGCQVSGGNAPFTYQWDFGDGSPASQLQNPVHLYTTSGSFTATVVVTDADGDTSSDTVVISVGSDDTPSALASASPTSGISPLAVSFNGSGIGGNAPLSYNWNFGDSSPVSTAQNPTHSYTAAGTYTAVLIVTDNDGDSANDQVTIEVSSDQIPVVAAAATPQSGIEPLTVSFSGSVIGGNAPITYQWDFGDGSPVSTAQNPSHTYSQGNFTASVTVTDADGDQASDTVTIDVGGDNVPSVTAAALPDSGQIPLPVSFTANVAGGNPPFTYSWNFGDGNTSTDQNPSHTFTIAGTYNVSVTVQDFDGDIASDIVVVQAASDSQPVANASASPSSGVAPLTISFFGSASGGDLPLSYQWNFGDGSPVSTLQNPTHTYVAGGTYNVTLIVQDLDGDSDSDTVSVQISDDEVPVAFVSANPTTGLMPLIVDFTCGASGGNPPLYFQWSFGDGSPVDDSPVTSHRYEIPGTFTATCTVLDTDGDSNSDSIEIHVGSSTIPAVEVSATPSVGAAPLDVSFSANVVGGTGPYTYLWDFGDGNSDTAQNPTHQYTSSGVYTATVQVTDFDGDIATDTVEIQVLDTISDLELTDFSVSFSGSTATYSITVTNNGPDPTQNFWVDLYYDLSVPPATSLFGDQARHISQTLTSGDATTLTFTRTVTAPGTEQSYAAVDINEGVPDPNRSNNINGPLTVIIDIIIINEVYYDHTGADAGTTFVEIRGAAGADLSGYEIVGVNGADGLDYGTFVIPAGTTIPANGLLVVAESTLVANNDVLGLPNLQNGPDSVQLRAPGGSSVIDAVAYGDFSGGFPAGEGTPSLDADEGFSVGRATSQPDTDDNATDFMVYPPTPGESNHYQNDICSAEFDLTINAVDHGDTTGYANDSLSDATTGCVGNFGEGADAVFLLTLTAGATVHLDTEGSSFDTVLYVRSTCDVQTSQLACDDDSGSGVNSSLEVALAAGTYYVIVDGYFSTNEGTFALRYWTL